MMVTFGGRSSDQNALKDTWGLRRHRDGRWDWVKAPYKAGSEEPIARYQHSTNFVGTLMIVLGGRTNTIGENLQLEVYETESSEWKKFPSLQRFRHSVWAIDTNLFMHGGFENDNPNVPTSTIMKLDLTGLFAKSPLLMQKLEQIQGAKSKKKVDTSSDNSDGTRTATPPMQSLARNQARIKLDKAEVEAKPGAGKTVHMVLNPDEEKKTDKSFIP
jgi:protein phosphatase